MPSPLAPPALPLLLTDVPRAVGELAATLATWSWLAAAPRGDGHTVLVLPGFLAGDELTAPLRHHLRRLGYDAHGWGHGLNWGRWEALDAIVLPLLDRLVERSGRPVSLVGASMGGLYARAAARRRPGQVRCVVTLGSAVQEPQRSNYVWPLYEAFTRQEERTMSVPAAPVPSTSVFSRVDGLSDWRPCVLPRSPSQENVAVASSHTGMVMHPASLYLIADRLAQPAGDWQPFAPPAALQWLYGLDS